VNEPKHTLAVLRRTIGLEQKEMAELLGCSPATIQAVEYGKLKLSESLASRIRHETGVDLEWLLSNDVSKPIPTAEPFGEPYSKARYEKHRARGERKLGEAPTDRLFAYMVLQTAIAQFAAVAASALDTQKDLGLFSFKAHHFIKELRQEFGENTRIAEKGKPELDRALKSELKRALKDNPLEVTGIYCKFFAKETRAAIEMLFEVVDAKLPEAKRTIPQPAESTKPTSEPSKRKPARR
jgi:transcriptional regulator with XRE-family HTH domain